MKSQYAPPRVTTTIATAPYKVMCSLIPVSKKYDVTVKDSNGVHVCAFTVMAANVKQAHLEAGRKKFLIRAEGITTIRLHKQDSSL